MEEEGKGRRERRDKEINPLSLPQQNSGYGLDHCYAPMDIG